MRPYIRELPPAFPALQVGQPLQAAAAQRAVFDAVTYALPGDLLILLKDALAAGASLSAHDRHGNDVFTLAVTNDRPHAISTLLALGATLPQVPNDGIDLLMRAAMLNHPECVDALIQIANLDLFAFDGEGRSALFYAAQSGAVQSAAVLLDAGAEPNQGTALLSEPLLVNIFGHNHRLDGRMVTPLMVATARGDRPMVELLMSNGAAAHTGGFPPLHIAADNHDPDMIEHLLRNGAEVAASLDWQANSPLATAIETDAPIDCLRLLAAAYPFDEDEVSDLDRPLALAIKDGRLDTVALFLAHGADPGPHVHGQPSAWRLATDARIGAEAIPMRKLHLLATTRVERWQGVEPGSDDAILAFHSIIRTGHDLASLASEGLYPSLLQRLQVQLAATPPGNDWPRMPQSALYAASLYLANGDGDAGTAAMATRTAMARPPAGPGPGTGINPASELAPDQAWHERTDRHIATQRSWLRQAATRLVQDNRDRLRHALTPDFFWQVASDCPDHTRLDIFIITHLSRTCGLPAPVTALIAEAWHAAARHARDWSSAAMSTEQSRRFIAQHMLALVAQKAASKLPFVPNPTSAAWVTELQQTASETLAMRGFATDPLAWLMRREQRHHLRAVDIDAVATALYCELGLPPDTCNTIAAAWADAIHLLATGTRGHAPHSWWRDAARALSPTIAASIVSDQTIPLPRVVRDLAEHWCVQQTGPLPGWVSVPLVAPVPVSTVTPASAPESGDAFAGALGGASPPASPPASPIASSPASQIVNPTSPTSAPMPAAFSAPPAPPLPPAHRKRSAEPDDEPRKAARHQ